MARSMLKSKMVPKEVLAQVVECVVYLSDRFPTKNLWNKTPRWTGRKPFHFLFENITYVHMFDQKHSKLDDKSETYFCWQCYKLKRLQTLYFYYKEDEAKQRCCVR